MEIGDLVRNKHTVRGSDADENGIVVDLPTEGYQSQWENLVKVMWFPRCDLVEYMTWMDTGDLEVLNESR